MIFLNPFWIVVDKYLDFEGIFAYDISLWCISHTAELFNISLFVTKCAEWLNLKCFVGWRGRNGWETGAFGGINTWVHTLDCDLIRRCYPAGRKLRVLSFKLLGLSSFQLDCSSEPQTADLCCNFSLCVDWLLKEKSTFCHKHTVRRQEIEKTGGKKVEFTEITERLTENKHTATHPQCHPCC